MTAVYLSEIAEQPRAFRSVLAGFTNERLRELDQLRGALLGGQIRNVILTGMGGSAHSAYGAWLRLSDRLPLPVSLWDTSELIQQAPGVIRRDTLVIAVSQSGESVELRKLTESAVRPFRAVSVTNGPSNSLSTWADIAVATQAGPEDAVSTKTYTAGLVALYAIEAALLGSFPAARDEIGHLAEVADQAMAKFRSGAEALLGFIGSDRPITFLGRGAGFSSATMSALMTVEATKLDASALTGGQFRHGPIELVRDGFRAVMFLGSGAGRDLNETTARDIARLGGRCLVIANDPPPLDGPSISVLPIPTVTAPLLPALEIIPLQYLMVPMALARGFAPAVFLNGAKVTLVE